MWVMSEIIERRERGDRGGERYLQVGRKIEGTDCTRKKALYWTLLESSCQPIVS